MDARRFVSVACTGIPLLGLAACEQTLAPPPRADAGQQPGSATVSSPGTLAPSTLIAMGPPTDTATSDSGIRPGHAASGIVP